MAVLLVALLVVLADTASADAQWMVSAYAGAVHTAPAEIHIEQPSLGTSLTFPDVTFESGSFKSPIYYGYRIAHSFPGAPWLFVEAELIHAKVYAQGANAPAGSGTRHGSAENRVPFTSVVQAFAMSHGLNFILINAVARRPISGDRVTFALRGGAGPMLPHPETVVEGERTEGYQVAGAGVQASGGIEIRVWRRVSALAEYKWTLARPRVSIHDGSAVVTTRSQHLAFGLSVQP